MRVFEQQKQDKSRDSPCFCCGFSYGESTAFFWTWRFGTDGAVVSFYELFGKNKGLPKDNPFVLHSNICMEFQCMIYEIEAYLGKDV